METLNKTQLDSVKAELASHIIDKINDGVLTNNNSDDWHFHAFNEDYYIVYHYRALEWLKSHHIGEFEAIDAIQTYEKENFGDTSTSINPEAMVNMLVYIIGEELLSEINAETVEELAEACEEY